MPSLRRLLASSFAAGLLLAGAPARAFVATGLSSFEGVEEPAVRYFPATGKFVPDGFVNITEVGSGVFRMTDRFGADWWDGDRNTQNRDRQRAEVKGLGPHQHNGQTFEYATTWRLNEDFHGAAGFCHLFQLKSVNGDSGAPLVTMSIHGDRVTIEANPAGKHFVAREFHWKPGSWLTVRIRITTSPNEASGALLASVNGDPFQGRTHVALIRPGADEYRPKWGLYRRAVNGAGMGTDYVEHRNVSAQLIGGGAVDNATLENEARELARNEPATGALAWLAEQPASAARDYAVGSIAALWAQSAPAAAMGWVDQMADPKVRADATERVFSRWEDEDAHAALDWVSHRAPMPDLDPLLWLMATDTTFRYVQRPVALAAAALISDSTLRDKAFEHVVMIWARSEPGPARAYVESLTALTPAQRVQLVAEIRARRRPARGGSEVE